MKKLNTVLLIDDDEVASALNETVIKDLDCCVDLIIFPNAIQGLNYFRQLCDVEKCPELIPLDLKMPIIDGFEFLKEFERFFTEYRGKVKIVLLTTSEREQDVAMAKLLGFDDYVVKPLTYEKVREF